MGCFEVVVTVDGDPDLLTEVDGLLQNHLRFRTKGPSCPRCRAMEARSDAGLEFDAPPLHRNCDCYLEVDEENS